MEFGQLNLTDKVNLTDTAKRSFALGQLCTKPKPLCTKPKAMQVCEPQCTKPKPPCTKPKPKQVSDLFAHWKKSVNHRVAALLRCGKHR